MSNRNYETQILDAIQMLVDNAVSKADYDKTIKATIVKCVDATIGKYTVKYQDSSFYAYSYNTDVTYTAGTMVYVLIPSNDMSQEKSIIGTVNKLGIDYVTVTEGENGYEVVGINGINSNAVYNLCSYKIKDIQVLYDRDANVDLVNLDAFSLETYIRQSSSIICGATFRTNLPLEQQFKGDYGIVFNLDFLDNATGKPVTRSYILNVDQMIGQPYKFSVGTRQYDIFEVDGSNFISVKQIYIFSYNFPKAVEGDSLAREDDIFVSKIELSAANALDPKSIGTAALTFITPRGTIFDDNHIDSDTKSIEAQIRIKSQVIDNESQDVKYYWFKENNKITTRSENYNRYGGTGWECLNLKNIIESATEDADAIVEWVPGTYSFITSKGNNVAKETTYKCVAVYNAETILSKEIVIYNYSSDYDITIDSDEGTSFYYDLGSPTLTCKINDEEELGSDYEYVWSSVDNNNRFANIDETPDDNVAYNEAFEEYSSLLQQIESNVVIESEVQERLAACKQIIDQYEYIMRVDRNKIYQLKISEITNFTTYKCSVFKSDIFIGTASIIISNNIQHDASQYNLVINNGNQIFKYNEQGVAPNSESLEYPIDILPLSFTLYDNEGREVTAEAIGLENIYWTIPNKDTLLTIDQSQGNPEEETEQGFVYNKLDQFNFGIAQRFNVNYTKNIIYLSIKYKEHVFSARTEFTFIKTGEIGTNGTDYICKIVPNARVNSIVPRYPMVTINEYSNAYKLNFETNSMDNWFKIQLWKNGEQIFEGTENGKSIENIDVKVTWSVLKNNYGNEVIDDSNFTINSSTGEIDFNTTQYTNPANIIKCTIGYDDAEYFATMPVMISRVKNDDYEILLSEDSGFRYAMYTADGRNPSYKERSPFTVMVSQIINGVKNNISLSEVENYKVDYEWAVRGSVYFSEEHTVSNLKESSISRLLNFRNEKEFQPADTFDGLCVNNALECIVTQNNERIGSIHIPIHLYLNRFGNASINGWDGNSISINEDGEGLILAPQVGAGIKDANNAFTGVFMGKIKETGKEKEEFGLFGYNSGERTITLSAEDGSARFGKTGLGQIVIDPATGEAVIRSGEFDETAGKGMQINLSEPSIKWGNGNFEVDKDGQIWATQYATKNMKFSSSSVDGLDDQLDDLDTNIKDLNSSVNYLDVLLPASSVVVETDTNRIPFHTTNKTLECVTTYKGAVVKPSVKIEGTHPGITNVYSSYDTERGVTILSFHVDSSTAITDATNNYNITFSYNDSVDCKPINKIISVLVVEKGRDGTSVSIQGTETNITTLCQNHSSGNTLGDGYILDDNGSGISGHLFVYTNNGKGNGSLPADWKDVGKIQGNDGTDGRGVQSIEYEYLTNNSSIKPSVNDTNWGVVMETPTEDKRYLWQKEIITFVESDGTHTPQETIFLLAMFGKEGKGITTIETKYQGWTDNVTIPTGEWLDNPPDVASGNYLWTRIRITYTDNSLSTDSYSITYIGKDGEQGKDGSGVDSVDEYYAISAEQPAINSELWGVSIPGYVKGLSYWKKIVTVWSDKTKADTVVIIKDEALTTANETAEAAKEGVDNIHIGGKNFIYNSGDFYSDLHPWISNEDEGSLIVGTINGTKLLIPKGAITQSISYQLKWDTEYVYHTYAKFAVAGNVSVEQPLHYQVWGSNEITNDRPSEYEDAIESIKAYVDGVENGLIEEEKWHHIELKFKTKKRNDITTEFVLFKPLFNGDTFITGQTYYINWIKLEEGNKATDWTAAPEETNAILDKIDNATEEAKDTAGQAEKTANEAKEKADAIDKAQIQLEGVVADNLAAAVKEIYIEYCQKDYIWTKFPANEPGVTYQPGTIYYVKNEDENSYAKVRPTLNEDKTFTFEVYTKSDPLEPTEEDSWSKSRPQWVDGKATYQRTVILYNNDKKSESTPYIVEDYQTIDDLRYQDALSVLAEMRGTNNIFYNSDGIFVYNGGTRENSTHAIIINNAGILFQHRESLNHEWDPASSVWTIEGHFDAKDIIVSNLTADSIVDGTLTLGNNSKDGELLIQDDQQHNRAELSSQRSIWTLEDGSAVIISKDCGFQMVAADGTPRFGNSLVWSYVDSGTYVNNINYYTEAGNLLSLIPEWTKDSDGNLILLEGQPIPSTGVYTVSYLKALEIAEQKVTEGINFGDILQTVNINTKDGSGLIHRGVAFVPKH